MKNEEATGLPPAASLPREGKEAFERYEDAVDKTAMTRNTKKTYIHRVEMFVRCLDDDFEPGAGLARARRRYGESAV